jgi:hypothetical protein
MTTCLPTTRRAGERKPLSVVALILATVHPQAAYGQYVVSVRAGLIDFVEGTAFVDQTPLHLPRGQILLLQNAARVRTERGKVEIFMGPNAALWLAEASALTLADSRLSDAAAVLESGSAIIEISQKAEVVKLSIRVGETTTVLTQPGLYRFDTGGAAEPRLRVYGGQAGVQLGSKQVSVQRGYAIRLVEGLQQNKFDRKKDVDKFYLWSSQRSFAAFKPLWRELHGNWYITQSGTAANDVFGAEVRDSSILSEFQREAREKKREQQELEKLLRQQEADRKRQEDEERRRSRQQGRQ